MSGNRIAINVGNLNPDALFFGIFLHSNIDLEKLYYVCKGKMILNYNFVTFVTI